MKTHTAHTPGPWRTDNRVGAENTISGAGKWLATFHEDKCTTTAEIHPRQAEALANISRAVACVNACEGIADPGAVPELLETLRDCADELETVCRRVEYEVESVGGSNMLAAWLNGGKKQLEQARAAIARATGEKGGK